jgi:hypothetical protein
MARPLARVRDQTAKNVSRPRDYEIGESVTKLSGGLTVRDFLEICDGSKITPDQRRRFAQMPLRWSPRPQCKATTDKTGRIVQEAFDPFS